MATTAGLRESLAWEPAISHQFLDDVRSGLIKPAQFNCWLAQDRLFVQQFTRFAGSLLRVSPLNSQDLILGGLGALKDELTWFDAKANERGVDLRSADNATMQPACKVYCEWMQNLHDASPVVQATAFWSIELVYNSAWRNIAAACADGPYREFTTRWGSDDFTEYVRGLAAMADALLASASEDEVAAATAAVKRVLELEVGFWDMAYFEAKGAA